MDIETKRKRSIDALGNSPKRRQIVTDLLGNYVLTQLQGLDDPIMGKVISFQNSLYRVEYENGEFYHYKRTKLSQMILRDNDFNDILTHRRMKLDAYVLRNMMLAMNKELKDAIQKAAQSSAQLPLLPPSSGTIAVPENHVPDLFFVYSFLSSYSIYVFLYPFTLDQFVGSLNYPVPNTLLDSIHVSLLRALENRHHQNLSSQGSELASKCFSFSDWSFLDKMTWPVYLAHYFTAKQGVQEVGFEGLYDNASLTGYYDLPAGRKLKILKVLCEDVLANVDIKDQMDRHEVSVAGLEREGIENSSTCQVCGMHGLYGMAEGRHKTLFSCDGCQSFYHLRCIGTAKKDIPKFGKWDCPECAIPKPTRTETSLRESEILGADPWGQLGNTLTGSGICRKVDGYLCFLQVVTSVDFSKKLKAFTDTEQRSIRYYHKDDIPKVLGAICCSDKLISSYSDIINSIKQYWNIPASFSCHDANVNNEDAGQAVEEVNMELNPSSKNQQGNSPDVPKGRSFEPYTYMNHYLHAHFSILAAKVLASLPPEEIKAHAIPRKGVSANESLQTRAFYLAASRFFWPTSQKRLLKVPSERCGWCTTCSTTSTRRCLLNSAILTATKAAMEIIDGIKVNSKEESVASMAKYILYLANMLSGLVGGPFLSAAHWKKWEQQVKEATTWSTLKVLLLKFVLNIRDISLAGKWCAQSSCGTANKCIPEATDMRLSWYRRGRLSFVPSSVVKKTARQSGIRKVRGIDYAGSSRRSDWRAAVQGSENASQLALQIRYLDFHVKWEDLTRPDKTSQDGKGQETEALAFDKAKICNKKVVADKTRYGVNFGGFQEPMKNVIESEQDEDGNVTYWLSETHVPLYLIKEYEQNVDKELFYKEDKEDKKLARFERKELKDSRRKHKNIFAYLAYKRDENVKGLCASCNGDLFMRDAIQCRKCQADIWSRVKTEGMTPTDLRMIESEEFLSMENPDLLFLEDGTENLHMFVPGSRVVSEQNQVPGSGVVASEENQLC
ncbi:hypothetical protein ACFE04_012005 [Oxalis oulophora]